MSSDLELLDALGEALAPQPCEPSPEEVAALRLLVESASPLPKVAAIGRSRHGALRRTQTGLAVVLAAAAMIGAVFVINRPQDGPPARDAAHAVSVHLQQVRYSMDALRAALAARDPRRLAHARDALAATLATLSPSERQATRCEAHALLHRANAVLRPGSAATSDLPGGPCASPAPGSSGSGEESDATNTVPRATTPATSGERSGGQSGQEQGGDGGGSVATTWPTEPTTDTTTQSPDGSSSSDSSPPSTDQASPDQTSPDQSSSDQASPVQTSGD
jgi:hypothetical protein